MKKCADFLHMYVYVYISGKTRVNKVFARVLQSEIYNKFTYGKNELIGK